MKEVEQQLQKASVEKASVDTTKGKTLDEISAIVEQINSQLKEKKNKLAPQIKALRSARQSFQAVETQHNEKKTVYDKVKCELDDDTTRVAEEVKKLETETQENEKLYHELNM